MSENNVNMRAILGIENNSRPGKKPMRPLLAVARNARYPVACMQRNRP